MVTRVLGFSKENFCSEKKLDSEEQKHKDTGGRNMRRKPRGRKDGQRGRKGVKQGRSQQCQMLPRGPLKELKGVLQT